MLKAVLQFFRNAHPHADVPHYVGQECFNCAYFSYCDPDDIDESDGYCGVNFAHDPNAEYGSWVPHDSWCKFWKEADAVEMLDRRKERALALRKAADAVDPVVGESTS